MSLLQRAKQSTKILLNLRRPPKLTSFDDQVFAAILKEGDVCFDIGANEGYVALFFARIVGPTGKVISFEPVLQTYMIMCESLQKDIGKKAPVVTLPFGLAECEKTASIQIPFGDSGYSSLARPEALTQLHPTATFVEHECRFLALDDFLRSAHGLVADFWKIDVEGAELFVLRGASQHFAAGNRPLIFAEVYYPWEQSFDYLPWDFLSPLVDLGYRFLFLCKDGLVEHQPTESTPFPPDFVDGYNLVAYVPERHADRIRNLERLRAGTGQALSYPAAMFPNRPAIVEPPRDAVINP